MVEPAVFTSSSRNPNGAIATVSCHFLGSPLGKTALLTEGCQKYTAKLLRPSAVNRSHCWAEGHAKTTLSWSPNIRATAVKLWLRWEHWSEVFAPKPAPMVDFLFADWYDPLTSETTGQLTHLFNTLDLNIRWISRNPLFSNYLLYIQHPQTWFSMVQCVPTAGRCPTILFCILTRNLACFCRALGCCVRRFITLAISAFICPCPRLRRRYAWKSSWHFPPRNALHGMHNKSLFSCNPHQAGNLQEGPYRKHEEHARNHEDLLAIWVAPLSWEGILLN